MAKFKSKMKKKYILAWKFKRNKKVPIQFLAFNTKKQRDVMVKTLKKYNKPLNIEIRYQEV